MVEEVNCRPWRHPYHHMSCSLVVGAIAQATKPRSRQKSKHIMRHFHLIREIVATRDIVVEVVPSAKNITDPLTKHLGHDIF